MGMLLMMMPRCTLLFLALGVLSAMAVPQTREEYFKAAKLETRIKTPAQLGIPTSLAKQFAGGDRRVDQSTAEAVIRRMWMYANGRVDHPSPAVQAEINRMRKEKKAAELGSDGVSLLEADEAGAEMADTEQQAEAKTEMKAAGKSCTYAVTHQKVDMPAATAPNAGEQVTIITADSVRSHDGTDLGKYEGLVKYCREKCSLLEDCFGIYLNSGTDPARFPINSAARPSDWETASYSSYIVNHTSTSYVSEWQGCFLKKGYSGSTWASNQMIDKVGIEQYRFASFYKKGSCTKGPIKNLKEETRETLWDIFKDTRDAFWDYYQNRTSITFQPKNLADGGNTIVWADNVAKGYNLATDMVNRTTVRASDVVAGNVKRVQEAVEKYQPVPKAD